jgi:hypothetical protein
MYIDSMANKDTSPGFSSFRQLMDIWDENLDQEEKKNQIRRMVDGENLILFFKKDGDVFGAPEESRVVFARMKNPDDETPEGWLDDANFIAVNLVKAMQGDKTTHMFSSKDLKSIKVVDKDAVEGLLMKEPAKKPCTALVVRQSPEGGGMLKLKDKKK